MNRYAPYRPSFTVTYEQAEPGVWFVTGDLGTLGPFETPTEASTAIVRAARQPSAEELEDSINIPSPPPPVEVGGLIDWAEDAEEVSRGD